MLQCPVTSLAQAVAKAKAVERNRLKKAKEDAYLFIQNGETNQQWIEQKIKPLSLFPNDHEAKQLITELAPKLLK
jgi:hypothetical protein